MKIIHSIIGCIAATLCFSACKKAEENPTNAASYAPFFNSGHGVRAVQVVTAGNNGTLQGFISADVSLSTASTLHWCYGRTSSTGENELFRRTINLNSGDTLPETGSFRGIQPKNLNNGLIRYAPYTNKLYNLVTNAAGSSIDGELQYSFGSTELDKFHPYANGDVLTGALTPYYQNGPVVNADVTSSIRRNGATTSILQRITHVLPDAPQYEHSQYRVGCFETDPDGNTVAIVINADSIIALRLSDGLQLAGIPYAAFLQTRARTTSMMRSKRSQDGTHMSCLFTAIEIASDIPTVTTLRYDFASRQITVVVPGVKPAGFQVSFNPQIDIDDDGAFYFPQNVDAAAGKGLKIIKQTGSSQQILATGFVADNDFVGLNFLKVISGKVFLALSGRGSTPGQTTNSSAFVLGVIE